MDAEMLSVIPRAVSSAANSGHDQRESGTLGGELAGQCLGLGDLHG
ncbi:hypothetical protein [Streptomyces sp. NPDC101150]